MPSFKDFFSLSFKGKMIAVVVIFIILMAAIKTNQIYHAIQMGKAFANPPPTAVEVTRVMKKEWVPALSSIGTLKALNGVDITPETSGIVKKILLIPGSDVKKGDILLQLDTAILNTQSKEAEARLNLAALNLDRTKSLLQSQATSAAKLDETTSNYQAARAQFDQIQALIAQKTIRAPFDGRVGLRQVQLGQFIGPNNVITSLESVDPILVEFSVAEQNIQKIKVGQSVVVSVSAFAKQEFKGSITAIDSKIGDDTKSINVQASLSNTDLEHLLIPGMFASINIVQPSIADQVVIPDIAIDYTLYGNSVYVVHENDGGYVAKRVFIKTGDVLNNETVVTSGLSGNELIVKVGQLKLHDGSKVSFKETE